MSVRIVVMGPSGSGKSTVGQALAERLGARFIDGDDLHPAANVAKMAAGVPLQDEDRLPWLRLVGAALRDHDDVVVACSALKRIYRDAIRSEAPDAFFAELSVSKSELEERMRARTEHFMPASLLESQLQDLEPLADDERGIRVGEATGVDGTADAIADAARSAATEAPRVGRTRG
jgi:carbohydrate kinase (thermoresistant glucokinase family)